MSEKTLVDVTVAVSERAGVTFTQASRAVDSVVRRDLGLVSMRDLERVSVLPATTRERIISLAVSRIRGRVR